MRAQRFIGLIVLVLIVLLSVIVKQQYYPDDIQEMSEVISRAVSDDLQTLERLKVQKKQKQIEYETAIILDKQGAIVWWRSMKSYSVVTLLVTVSLSLVISALALYNHNTKYPQQIGESHLTLRKKDMNVMTWVAAALAIAEQMKQEKVQQEKLFALYERFTGLISQNLNALGKHRPAELRDVTPQAPMQSLYGERGCPSFAELLESRDIGRGKDMILCFTHGKPRIGSFMDIYSAAVAGESGSGKTGTLLYLIASGLLSGTIRFAGIDPHYPHPKGLGAKTEPLWKQGHIKMATYKDDMETMLIDVERTIDRRLKQTETDTTPVILIIDELAFLMRTSLQKALTTTMVRISTEGRKCDVFMLASSQLWLASTLGEKSEVRDSLVSSYVHRIKPKQASYILQDKSLTDILRKEVRGKGEVLFCPVCGDPVVGKIPLTTPADILEVTQILDRNGNGNRCQRIDPIIDTHVDNVDTGIDKSIDSPERKAIPSVNDSGFDPDLVTKEIVTETIAKFPSQAEAAREFGISPSYLNKVLREPARVIPIHIRRKVSELVNVD